MWIDRWDGMPLDGQDGRRTIIGAGQKLQGHAPRCRRAAHYGNNALDPPGSGSGPMQ